MHNKQKYPKNKKKVLINKNKKGHNKYCIQTSPKGNNSPTKKEKEERGPQKCNT